MLELGVAYRNITRADRAATDALASLGSATVHEAMGRVALRPLKSYSIRCWWTIQRDFIGMIK